MPDAPHLFPETDPFSRQLAAARCGSREELGRLIETFRGYLLAVAGSGLDGALRVKMAPSDIVQETMIQAQQHFEQFRGDCSRELLGWLREILTNNLLRAARMYHVSEMRQLARERPMAAGDADRIPAAFPDPAPTPRAALSACEESQRLKVAIDQLPVIYRHAVLLRNWEDLSFEDVGRRLGRSPEAARKLWMRALRRLRRNLAAEDSRVRPSREPAPDQEDPVPAVNLS